MYRGLSQLLHDDLHWLDVPQRVQYKLVGGLLHTPIPFRSTKLGTVTHTKKGRVYKALAMPQAWEGSQSSQIFWTITSTRFYLDRSIRHSNPSREDACFYSRKCPCNVRAGQENPTFFGPSNICSPGMTHSTQILQRDRIR